MCSSDLIKPPRDRAVGRVVLSHIRVEEIDRHPANVGPPDLRVYRAPPDRNLDLDRLCANRDQFEWVFDRVYRLLGLFLPTV